jgi:hypothetical protein
MRPFFLYILTFILLTASCSNPCKNIDCTGNGSCNQGICICKKGFEGRECDQEIRKKFLGNFDVTEECSSGATIYDIKVDSDSENAEKIILHNIYNKDYKISAVVNSDQFIIDTAEFASIGKITGTGRVIAGDLKIEYNVLSGSTQDVCIARGKRK